MFLQNAKNVSRIWKFSRSTFNRYAVVQSFSLDTTKLTGHEPISPGNVIEPEIPPYKEKFDEPMKLKKARLLYQSRKRGMLENGLLLSTFAAKYLESMTEEELKQYDRLINLPTNDWDLYYWATGVKPVPLEFNNEIMGLFREHVQNKDRESRCRQPDLY